VAGITIVSDKFAIERGRNFWPRDGILVLRFWNPQVRRELDSVLQAIWFALQERCSSNPHLNPLPLAKGEASERARGYGRAKAERISVHFSRLAPLVGRGLR